MTERKSSDSRDSALAMSVTSPTRLTTSVQDAADVERFLYRNANKGSQSVTGKAKQRKKPKAKRYKSKSRLRQEKEQRCRPRSKSPAARYKARSKLKKIKDASEGATAAGGPILDCMDSLNSAAAAKAATAMTPPMMMMDFEGLKL